MVAQQILDFKIIIYINYIMEQIKFTNEIGNKIEIKVKNKNDIATNNKTKEKVKFKGVNIKMIGPTSMSENMITREEAKMLHKTLGKFLRK